MGRELEDIRKAIQKWMEKHNNDVVFHGSFIAFDKDGEIVDDMVFCYGDKKTLQLDIKEFVKAFAKEDGEFINW